MTTVIPQVVNTPYVNNCEFVKMIITNMDNTNTVYTFSSSYKPEDIDGVTYTPLGGLLNVGIQQRDMRVTNFDTSVTLSGLGPDNIYAILATKIKGSTMVVYRGFYDTNYNLVNTVLRFSGVITSYTISEELQVGDHLDNFTVSVNGSSFKTILDTRTAGRATSPKHWNEYENPPSTLDNSMVNVPNLVNAHLDFGMPVSNQGASV